MTPQDGDRDTFLCDELSQHLWKTLGASGLRFMVPVPDPVAVTSITKDKCEKLAVTVFDESMTTVQIGTFSVAKPPQWRHLTRYCIMAMC